MSYYNLSVIENAEARSAELDLNQRGNQALRFSVSTMRGGGDATPLVRLRIEEVKSATIITEVDFDPGDFWKLISGTSIVSKAFVAPNLRHVGKWKHAYQRHIPRSVYSEVAQDERLTIASIWAAEQIDGYLEAPLAEIRDTNGGLIAHWWTFDDTPPEPPAPANHRAAPAVVQEKPGSGKNKEVIPDLVEKRTLPNPRAPRLAEVAKAAAPAKKES